MKVVRVIMLVAMLLTTGQAFGWIAYGNWETVDYIDNYWDETTQTVVRERKKVIVQVVLLGSALA